VFVASSYRPGRSELTHPLMTGDQFPYRLAHDRLMM
jgi:hypothetical protein